MINQRNSSSSDDLLKGKESKIDPKPHGAEQSRIKAMGLTWVEEEMAALTRIVGGRECKPHASCGTKSKTKNKKKEIQMMVITLRLH